MSCHPPTSLMPKQHVLCSPLCVNVLGGIYIDFVDTMVPSFAVADIVHDVESRCKWDKLFSIIEVLDSYENHRIVYWYVSF